MILEILLTAIALALVGFTFFHRKETKRSRRKQIESNLWSNVAQCFYWEETSGNRFPLEKLLRTVAEYLQADTAIVSLRTGVESQVLFSWSRDEYWTVLIKPRSSLAPYLTYCGSLGRKREFLAISFASLSEWRKHPAYQNQKIESYIGSFRQLSDQAGVSVCFFSQLGRDQLYQDTHKALVDSLNNWIARRIQDGELLQTRIEEPPPFRAEPLLKAA